ncbi:MAG: folate-binding protein YgfZ [Pirellulales bacterium]|nr:folate-binding protein YgfZ [Pirellulales bacterium]
MNRDELKQQYEQAVSEAAALRLEKWTTLKVAGEDRAGLLHNMCTNDIRGLTAGEGCEAFFTDVKGKIVAHAFVLVGAEAIEVVSVPEAAMRLLQHLDRYIVREDVRLEDMSTAVDWHLLTGKQAASALRRFGSDASGVARPWSHQRLSASGVDIQAVRCTLPWCGGFLLSSDAEQTPRFVKALRDSGAGALSAAAWHAIRIESGWPLYGVDFDASNLPQEVGRDSEAIHFRKGCYLGQETVARIDALGHVNKRLALVRLASEAVPPSGAELLFGDQAAGRVTSNCWSPRHQSPLAWAMVRRGAHEPGCQLRWGEVEARVVQAAPPGG